MKNKGVNILAILAVVLVLAVIGVALVLILREPADDGSGSINGGYGSAELDTTVLKLDTVEQFQEFAEAGGYECHIGDDLSGGSVYGVPLLGAETVVTYYFDEQGQTKDFETFYLLNAAMTDSEEITAEQLTTEELALSATDTLEQFCMMFGCELSQDLYLENTDGTFTLVESSEDFQAIMDGTAILRFSIRDAEGYYWKLTLSSAEGLVSVNIRKYFDVEACMDYIANISLYEEE